MADFNKLLGELDEFDSNQSHKKYKDKEFPRYTIASSENLKLLAKSEVATINNSTVINYDDLNDTKCSVTSYTDFDISDNNEKESDKFDNEYHKLKRMWIQEINSPEILPCDFETISILIELLREQEETIEKIQKKRNILNRKCNQDLMSLARSICKMDADRLKFLLTDLIRSRMAKLEKYALHNREVLNRLGDHEVSYLKQYGELFERHMKRSVINNLPKDAWKNLDDPEMVDRPDLDIYVFCNVLDDIQIDNRHYITNGSGNKDTTQLQYYSTGSTLFLRYDLIQKFIHTGKVELLM